MSIVACTPAEQLVGSFFGGGAAHSAWHAGQPRLQRPHTSDCLMQGTTLRCPGQQDKSSTPAIGRSNQRMHGPRARRTALCTRRLGRTASAWPPCTSAEQRPGQHAVPLLPLHLATGRPTRSRRRHQRWTCPLRASSSLRGRLHGLLTKVRAQPNEMSGPDTLAHRRCQVGEGIRGAACTSPDSAVSCFSLSLLPASTLKKNPLSDSVHLWPDDQAAYASEAEERAARAA